jgi:PilZ domain
MFDSNPPTRGIHCQGCDQRLPLRMSGTSEIAALWECAACSTAFAGVLVPELVPSLAKLVRLSQIHFGDEHVDPLLNDFSQIVKELMSRQANAQDHEQRRSPREIPNLDAMAIGLDANFMVAVQSCRGVVVNLSSHGMLLATPVQLHNANVAVQMHGGGERVQLLGRIVWSRHLGGSCYGAGIDFVARLGKVASAPGASFGSSADAHLSAGRMPTV